MSNIGEAEVAQALHKDLEQPPEAPSTSLGISRYGRTRKPKISEDFCDINDLFINIKPTKSPTKSASPVKRKGTPSNASGTGKKRVSDINKSPNVKKEVVPRISEVKLAVESPSNRANKTNFPVKERKFFKSSRSSLPNEKLPEEKPAEELNQDVLPVDVTKVLKIVASKSEISNLESKPTVKPMLRTYGNKRKIPNKSDNFETFGLPDNPIVPAASTVKSNVPTKLDKNLDIDVSSPDKVNLANAKVWEASKIDLEETDKNDCTFDEDCCADSIFDEVRVKADEAVANRTLKTKDTGEKKNEDRKKSKAINDKVNKKQEEKDKIKNKSEKRKEKSKKLEPVKENVKKKSGKNNKDKILEVHKALQKTLFDCSSSDVIRTSIKPSKEKSESIKIQKVSKESNKKELRSSVTMVKSKIETVDLTNAAEIVKNEAVNGEASGDKMEQKKAVLLDPSQIKRETKDFEVGDLMWARVGSHPYWPCCITVDPELNVSKRTVFRMKLLTLYHVRFFGDKGRRSWIDTLHIIPFVNGTDLEMLLKRAKQENKSADLSAYIVKQNKLEAWKLAVKEAVSLKNKNSQERLDFFFDMFASKSEKKRKLLGLSENLASRKIKTEPGEIKRTHVRRSFVKQPKEFVKRSRSYTPSSKTDSLKETVTKSSSSADVSKLTKNDSSLDVSKVNEGSSSADVSKVEEKEIFHKQLRSSKTDADNIESKPDTEIKTVDLSEKLKEQEELFKINNIFKGVPKDRVCQICEKPNDVHRCRGPCNGIYHAKCASNTKPAVLTNGYESDVSNLVSEDGQQSENVAVSSTVPCNGICEKDLNSLTLAEKIDLKMREVMKNFELKTIYADSTTDYSSSEENSDETNMTKMVIKHVTADGEFFDTSTVKEIKKKPMRKSLRATIDTDSASVASSDDASKKDFKCYNCTSEIDYECFACNKNVSPKGSDLRQRCSLPYCGKYYHPECLKVVWPQTQWSLISTTKHKQSEVELDTFICPMHVCHTCVSDDPRSSAFSRCSNDKLIKCLRCPTTYHTTNYCVPAGTVILSTTQIVCPRHVGSINQDRTKPSKAVRVINAAWCFICSEGGDLICCQTCPTSVHSGCLQINLRDDDSFICEDCESGRFPLYDEIVWAKLGKYRWWPARILFPNEIPDNIRNVSHHEGEFVIKFFGTNDHYWSNRGKVFLFQDDDRGQNSQTKNKVDDIFNKAVDEAIAAHHLKKSFKKTKEAEINAALKPPNYIRIKSNKPVGNMRLFDGNISNTTPCECNPKEPHPCGPDSNCLNRLLLTECNPDVCPAGRRCENQRFEKRQYPAMEPYKTPGRGWGLKTLVPIEKGQFIIEYVGEIIDDQEYLRRIRKMHEQKDENYYFLTIDKDRIIDAGPKGNLSRFMNHSCKPNCETQKWTVNGITRVGLFASESIPANTEITFNYNLECVGKEKKVCRCGASVCSGFIGVKVKQEESQRKPKKSSKKKKRSPTPVPAVTGDNLCFKCGKGGDVNSCHNKICTKYYHLKCVDLMSWPEGKWVCPWHNCNVCSKRTIRCCVKCINSYCPPHSEGNVRHDKLLGFVCSEHDPSKESQEIENECIKQPELNTNASSTEETDITSTTTDEIISGTYFSDVSSSGASESQTTKECVTSTPLKKRRKSADISEPDRTVSEKRPQEQPRKRGRPRKSLESIPKKKLKLKTGNLNVVKPILPVKAVVDNSVFAQNEVKLSGTVPTRHLRQSTKAASEESSASDLERFLKRQLEYEKDLPIRKRSRARFQTNL